METIPNDNDSRKPRIGTIVRWVSCLLIAAVLLMIFRWLSVDQTMSSLKDWIVERRIIGHGCRDHLRHAFGQPEAERAKKWHD